MAPSNNDDEAQSPSLAVRFVLCGGWFMDIENPSIGCELQRGFHTGYSSRQAFAAEGKVYKIPPCLATDFEADKLNDISGFIASRIFLLRPVIHQSPLFLRIKEDGAGGSDVAQMRDS